MTLKDLFDRIAARPEPVLLYFALLPLLAGGIGFACGSKAAQKPYSLLFSTLIYLSCIPGIFSAMILLDDLFTRRGWRNFDVYTQILPVISMALTVRLISQKVSLDLLPGFKRLSGFITLIAATFLVIFVLERLNFHVLFLGSVWQLFLLFALIFLLLKYGWERFTH